MLMISISPVQWSFANDLVNPMDSMGMDVSHDADCVSMTDGTDSTSCKMDHESMCKTFYNCFSKANFPTFQVNTLFQWSSALTSGTKFYDAGVRLFFFYPELLKRPPIV